MQVVYVCDTETTGLDPNKNDVIEVSFWRLSDDQQKTWCIKPLSPENIEDSALKINGHKKEDILLKTAFGRETYHEPSDAVSEIEMWVMDDGTAVEDRIFVGQNPKFDWDFLLNLWKKVDAKESFPFSRFILDTIQLARLIDFCTGKTRERYNLSALVKDFGVTRHKAHRAADDVKMTKELFEKMISPIKLQIATQFAESYK